MRLTTLAALHSRGRIFLFALATLIGVLGSMMWAGARYHDCEVRCAYECSMHLMDLRALLLEETSMLRYYPSNLNFVLPVYKPSPFTLRTHTHVLLCPGSKTCVGSQRDLVGLCDYAYVDWSRWFDDPEAVPAGFPMIYDRRLSNHGGRGVYILRSEGFVMWDPGGQWLSTFAAKHPEYKLTLPE
jgi:hypothetical protein